MQQSEKLVFWGTEDFSVPALRGLVERGWPIAAVITKPDAKKGRGLKIAEPAVKTIAKTAGIPVLQPTKIESLINDLEHLQARYGVLAAYGKIIPERIINLFDGGIVNIHPSLLPKYRGPAPIEAAILNGDRYSGISLMKLSAGMDEGPVYAQKRIALSGHENQKNLSEALAQKGADFLLENLPKIINGELMPRDQDDSKASYTKLLNKSDGVISWDEPAAVIERKVRTFIIYPRSRARLYGVEVIVTGARVAQNAEDGNLVVQCNPGFIEITELIVPSGRKISGNEFIRGYGQRN